MRTKPVVSKAKRMKAQSPVMISPDNQLEALHAKTHVVKIEFHVADDSLKLMNKI